MRLQPEFPASFEATLRGCDAAYYLLHGLGSGPDYAASEASMAKSFSRAAGEVGLERIVYLGGVAPLGTASKHLASRLRTGELLAAGRTPVVELRASMVIGTGSASWQLVRDLLVRLPWLAFPPWLDHLSSPIAIEDVVLALVAALGERVPPGCWELPGPELLSHRTLLERVAAPLGTRISERRLRGVSPRALGVLASLLASGNRHLVRELVAGLGAPLVPGEARLWDKLEGVSLVSIDHAIHQALEGELSPEGIAPGLRRRLLELGPAWLPSAP